MSNNKDKRETLYRLKDGKNFQKKLLDRVHKGEKLDDDDFQIALDALRKQSGIINK